MIGNKFISRIGVLVVCLAVIFSVALMCAAEITGVKDKSTSMAYETGLFDTSYVHTINITISEADWEALLENASEKEYYICAVTIDGKTVKNVAIRAKGNSSLSTVRSQGGQRYSLKLEFDHYSEGQNYQGLDKLNLNNIVGDYTYMKDFLSYTLMREMGVESPLCSYIYVQVNGEDFGLYLAVEGIEDSFSERNYGEDGGEIYKPDSMDMNDAKQEGGGPGGSGSTDVALVYQGEDADSYSHIFDNAITKTSDADKKRLISAIKKLNEGESLEETVNVDEVLRYFVVHSFVCNFDSYTGNMMHNYYLHEKNGKISIIAWDYNLAFGGFNNAGGKDGAGSSTDSATQIVNFPIDTPVSGTTMEERPLLNQLLTNYTDEYHAYYAEFIEKYFDSGYFSELLEATRKMIAAYVEKDPTKFCTYEQFKAAVDTLSAFSELRAESVKAQLTGTIPSTSEGQKSSSQGLVDASGINLSTMGSIGGGGGGKEGGGEAEGRTPPEGGLKGAQQGRAQTAMQGGDTDTAAAAQGAGASSEQSGRAEQFIAAENGGRARAVPPGGNAEKSGAVSANSLLYLGASLGLLALALLWVKLTKKRKWG